MRLLPLVLLLPAILMAYDFRIDHVTVAGSSVQRMQAALSAAGIASVYGGPHIDGVTEMALVSFPDGSYLEFIGLQAKAAADLVDRHVWARYLRGDAGPTAWALRADNMAAEVHRLESAGIPVSTPQRNGRRRPDGVQLEWETASAGAEPRGTFFPFLIHDFTPREQRADPQGKPSTADFRGISEVVIGVRDLEAAVKRYRQAYGLGEPAWEENRRFGARLARWNGSPVVLAQALADDSWLAKRVRQFGEIPCAFILGAVHPERYRAASPMAWFGGEVSWFDSDKLGWRIGFTR